MESKINLYTLLSGFDLPVHWPVTSVYRLRSVKAKVLRVCTNDEIEINKLPSEIKRITKTTFQHVKISQQTLNTYRTTLSRYIIEKVENRKLQPWEATRFIKALNKKNLSDESKKSN